MTADGGGAWLLATGFGAVVGAFVGSVSSRLGIPFGAAVGAAVGWKSIPSLAGDGSAVWPNFEVPLIGFTLTSVLLLSSIVSCRLLGSFKDQ